MPDEDKKLEALMVSHPGQVFAAARDAMERSLLTSVMKFTNNNQSHATRILGVNRGTLRAKLARYNLD